MQKTKQNQFMAMLFIALALFIGVFLVTSGQMNFTQRAGYTAEGYTKIQGDDDLDRASTTLDGVDIDSMDSELDQNELDSSSF